MLMIVFGAVSMLIGWPKMSLKKDSKAENDKLGA